MIQRLHLFRAAPAMAALLIAACSSNGAKPPAQPAAPSKPAAPVYMLDDILGAAPAALDAKLGAPALTRREGKGEYRRYRLKSCTLIVLLYPDETGMSHAAHVDTAALMSGGEKPDLDKCLAAG